jgi:hypothetical protein
LSIRDANIRGMPRCGTPPFGAHLDPAGPRQHDQGGVGGVHAGERFGREVHVPGRVDEVDLRVHPLRHRDGEIDGVFALDFVGSVIGEGAAVLYGAVALARTGHEREGIDERGLAARAVAHHGHVADLPCSMDAHLDLRLGRIEYAPGWRSRLGRYVAAGPV